MSTQTVRPSTGDSSRRRGQALAGALAGVAIVVVLTAVFFIVKSGDSDKSSGNTSAAAAAQTSPSEAAGAPTEAAPTEQPTAAAPASVDTPAALAKEPDVKAGSGTLSKIVVTPLVAGRGPAVKKGQTITANYKVVSYKTGQVIDSSWSRGEPFTTQIGVGAVIQGFDQGIPGQKVGSRIQLDVPAALAYGPQQGDLRFVVDILAAK
jgi:peptidylprolyl isomerase